MAMTKIVERLGWKYMSIIYEESNYGIKVCTLIMDHRLVQFFCACLALRSKTQEVTKTGAETYDFGIMFSKSRTIQADIRMFMIV